VARVDRRLQGESRSAERIAPRNPPVVWSNRARSRSLIADRSHLRRLRRITVRSRPQIYAHHARPWFADDRRPATATPPVRWSNRDVRPSAEAPTTLSSPRRMVELALFAPRQVVEFAISPVRWSNRNHPPPAHRSNGCANPPVARSNPCERPHPSHGRIGRVLLRARGPAAMRHRVSPRRTVKSHAPLVR
jgi:hypothetical protein